MARVTVSPLSPAPIPLFPRTGREEEKRGKAELKAMNKYHLVMPSACATEIACGDGALNSALSVPYKALG